jgi:phage gp29-like protein
MIFADERSGLNVRLIWQYSRRHYSVADAIAVLNLTAL